MPRTVKVRHKTGEVEYIIYEKPEDVVGTISELHNASEGDFIIAANGWICPLIKRRTISNLYKRTVGGYRTLRKNPVIFHEFIFPKMKWICREDKLLTKEFNYIPTTSANAGRKDELREKAFRMSSRKLLFCRYIIEGVSPTSAASIVFSEYSSPSYFAKKLLLEPVIIDYLLGEYKMNKNLKGLLDERVTDNDIANKLVDMLNGENPADKRWALSKIIDIKHNKTIADEPPPQPKQLSNGAILEENRRKYIGHAQPLTQTPNGEE